MYTLARLVHPRQLVMEQAATFGTALVVAEFFYKFHSFTLECLAFLATWAVLDYARDRLVGSAPPRTGKTR
ncbi:MAG TPA: hypothetical protein VF006_01445 [Longimicrobium sp.]